MTENLEAAVLQALTRVKDPDLHRDIVSLGFIKDLQIKSGRVSFTIELTTPACPVREKMREEAYKYVSAVPGVREVEIQMAAKVRPTRGEQKQKLIPTVKNVIAVASGKGGVGKSTVSANLALALARAGAKVGLMDADVYGPSIPLIMGVEGVPQAAGDKIAPMERYGVKVISMGFFLPKDEAVIWRGPMLHKVVHQFLGDVDWGELDYLIVDLPPGCLTADTLVFTEQGPTPISEMGEGMHVYSFDGHLNKASHKSPWEMHAALIKRKVLAAIPQGKAKVYELKTATRCIKGTEDHPLLVLRRRRRENSPFYNYSLEWAKLGELKRGDIILTVKRLPDEPSRPLRLPKLTAVGKTPLSMPEYSSDDFMRLVGYFLGDGFVRMHSGKYWGIWFSEPEGGKYRPKYVHLLKQLFGLTHIHQQPQKFAAISAQLAQLFEKLGLHKKALGKRIPSWVFTLPASQKLAFIEGYCDADGHRRAPRFKLRRPGWMAFESPNKQLMEDLRALCLYAGLKIEHLRCRTRKIRVPSTQQLVTQTFWGFEANQVTKTSLYGAGVIRGPIIGRGLHHEYIGFERVKEVKFIGLEEVYDLHVEGEHNFAANGFIVHNTGDVQLSLCQTIPLTGAVIVSTPQDVALSVAQKAIAMFRKLNCPVLGLIENMSYFVCKHCGRREEIFGSGGARRACERLKIPFLGEIPLATEIRTTSDEGHPIVISDPSSPISQAFIKVAESLAAQISISHMADLSVRAV